MRAGYWNNFMSYRFLKQRHLSYDRASFSMMYAFSKRYINYTLVVSQLEYASMVKLPHYIHLQVSIETVQRRFLKFLPFEIDKQYPVNGIDYESILQGLGYDRWNTVGRCLSEIYLEGCSWQYGLF